MNYKVTEIFNSIQGEGIFTGSPVTFVRMSGCNLRCVFCDTSFSHYMEYTPSRLVQKILAISKDIKDIVFTGGEPLLQPIHILAVQLKNEGKNVHIETNGTVAINGAHELMYSSISMSPKASLDKIKLRHCTSLKILYPYISRDVTAESFAKYDAWYKFIQPIDRGNKEENDNILSASVAEVLRLGSGWRLGLQIHKFLNIQ